MGLCHRFEPLEAQCEPIAIGAIFVPARQMNGPAIQSLQGFEHRAIVPTEQPIRDRDMQPILGVNSDEMSVERCMMTL